MTTFDVTPPVAWPPEVVVYGCDSCGDSYPEADLRVGTESEVFCSDCADDLCNCARCGLPSQQLSETINGHEYCNTCISNRSLVECDRCNRYARNSAMQHNDDGDDICRYCASEHYVVCQDWYCRVLIPRHGDEAYCPQHEPEDEESDCDCCDSYSGDELIYSYSHKPEPEFHGNGPMFLGLELEIYGGGDRRRAAAVANRHLGGLGYLKEDSSVSDGFEIVTHPMSHQYARESFPWQMLEDLKQHGATDGGNGLHVHVSREAFKSPTHIYRWLKFLYRNSEFVSVIARRESGEWAAWSYDQRQAAGRHAKGDRYGHRYSAVNVQNWATFEVRVFASTLERKELMAALDLVAASVEYTRDLTVHAINHHGGWQWSAFRQWVSTDRPEYTALSGEMEDLCAC